MNTSDSVPKIDLAPKLKRPLSLWNPLDYLRLLYWVFYFPQALRWYEKTFGNGDFSDARAFQQRWQWLRQNPIQQRLILQSLIVLFVVDFGSAKLLEILGFSIDWIGLAGGMFAGLVFGLFVGWDLEIAIGVTFGIAIGVTFGIAFGVFSGVASGVVGVVAIGITMCLGSGLGFGVFSGLGFGVNYSIYFCVSFSILFGIAWAITCVIALSVVILRPESWLLDTIFSFSNNHYLLLSHISPIPGKPIFKKITKDLEKDWKNGLYNASQIIEYTVQLIPVLRAINFVLATTLPANLLPRVSLLAQQPFDWDMVKFASASLSNKLKNEILRRFFIFPFLVKNPLTHNNLSLVLRTDTPARAAAAGFWYLHKKDSAKALQSFLKLQSFPYGQEICLLAEFLMLCDQAIIDDIDENPIDTIADIPILLIPPTPHLHPDSWPIIAGFQQVITDIKIVKTSDSRTNKSLALNRALGELDKILKQSKKIVTAERDLILKIAEVWQRALLTVTSEIGEIAILEPVISPYTIGDPVEGDAFVGRDDIMNQLSELWRQKKSVQSVVLYGHRRMGKTSILRNINDRLGGNVSLAYVNMLLMTNPQGEADILMFICDQIKLTTGVDIPANAEFIAFPETTCRRYIQGVLEKMNGKEDPHSNPLPRRERGQETSFDDSTPFLSTREKQKILPDTPSPLIPNEEKQENWPDTPAPLLPTWEKGLGDEGISMPPSESSSSIAPPPQKINPHKLIIAIDEFEVIDTLIADQKISPEFLAFLRGLVQISPHIAFAFAGLHTLEERVANYSDPFFASFIPIPVGFLSLGATRQLLANPADPDFPLDYTPETLDNIYQLTAGQPYLTQLVGFQLVRHYNQQVFESGHIRDPIFTIDDLNTVIQDPVFFDRGRYYFTGVWSQASQDVPHQQTILTALAPHLTGLSLSELSTVTNLTLTELNAALKVLERHDVAVCEQEKWRISIELFRRWLIDSLSETLRERHW